jgi:hypothetical protein
MYKVAELFGNSTANKNLDWKDIIKRQICPFVNKRCYKVRKSQPEIAIGTCIVRRQGETVEQTAKRFI